MVKKVDYTDRVENPTQVEDYEYLCVQICKTAYIFLVIHVRSWVTGTENVKSSRDQARYFQESQITLKTAVSANGWEGLSQNEASFMRDIFTNAQGLKKNSMLPWES